MQIFWTLSEPSATLCKALWVMKQLWGSSVWLQLFTPIPLYMWRSSLLKHKAAFQKSEQLESYSKSSSLHHYPQGLAVYGGYVGYFIMDWIYCFEVKPFYRAVCKMMDKMVDWLLGVCLFFPACLNASVPLDILLAFEDWDIMWKSFLFQADNN